MKTERSGSRSITCSDDQRDDQDGRTNINPNIFGESPDLYKQKGHVAAMRYYIKCCYHRIYYPVANPMAALMEKRHQNSDPYPLQLLYKDFKGKLMGQVSRKDHITST